MMTCIISLFILVVTSLMIGIRVSVDFNNFRKEYEKTLKNHSKISDCYSEKINRLERKINTIYDQLPPKEVSVNDAEHILQYNVFGSHQKIKIIDKKENNDED